MGERAAFVWVEVHAAGGVTHRRLVSVGGEVRTVGDMKGAIWYVVHGGVSREKASWGELRLREANVGTGLPMVVVDKQLLPNSAELSVFSITNGSLLAYYEPGVQPSANSAPILLPTTRAVVPATHLERDSGSSSLDEDGDPLSADNTLCNSFGQRGALRGRLGRRARRGQQRAGPALSRAAGDDSQLSWAASPPPPTESAGRNGAPMSPMDADTERAIVESLKAATAAPPAAELSEEELLAHTIALSLEEASRPVQAPTLSEEELLTQTLALSAQEASAPKPQRTEEGLLEEAIARSLRETGPPYEPSPPQPQPLVASRTAPVPSALPNPAALFTGLAAPSPYSRAPAYAGASVYARSPAHSSTPTYARAPGPAPGPAPAPAPTTALAAAGPRPPIEAQPTMTWAGLARSPPSAVVRSPASSPESVASPPQDPSSREPLSPEALSEEEQLDRAIAESMMLQDLQAGAPVKPEQAIVEVPTDLMGHVVGKKFAKLLALQRKSGCNISVPPRAEGSANSPMTFVVIEGSPESVHFARTELVRDVERLRPRHLEKAASTGSQEVHMFVDFSNILLGFSPNNSPYDLLTQFSVSGLVDAVVQGRPTTTLCVAGSFPAEGSRVWSDFRDCGFETHVDPRRGQEKFVDEFLHAQILRRVCRRATPAGPRKTLVLLTGDGNANDGKSNFPECVQIALENGWHVELWSWRRSTSKHFHRLAREFPHTMAVIELDMYVDYLRSA
mmetsp:Transcript_17638/g.68472  ORF Transcript_17638/g.68472 Transcript_17638/m.68472 type:complete len:736 (+) Transcript_17638:92-2299(+)